MTDINASLKKTIDGQPGPQYKEKNKAEFNFAEGEDGKPYSYDKDVEAKLEELKTTNESRLTAIENKLDSVIDNDSINTQLTGSNVEYLPTKEKGKYVRESSDVRPNGQEGDSLFLWNTREVFLHDGTDWREV